MAESNNSSTADAPDKNLLYGWWFKSRDWQDSLHKKAAHKALDIPEDMGDITSTKQVQSGMGWKELVAIGAMGLGGAYMLKDDPATPAASPPAATAPVDVTQKFDVLHYDQDGNLIDIQRLPENLKQ